MSAAPPTIGGYSLESKLGAGGMGAVYRARHARFPGREFALKVLTHDGAPSSEQTERFAREMKALAAVTAHPNVVRIFGGAIEGATPFYVMELVEGPSLASLVREKGLDLRRAAGIARTIADAVAYVHDKGIVHRDLKPQNILIAPGDVPRVCDFGLAKIAESERLTRSGAMFGTPAYSAPEQLDGRANKVDHKADVYSLGAILWFSLVGRPPLVADSNLELLNKVLVQPAEPPSRHAKGIPPELDAICLHALEKEPEKRYPSAAAFRDDIDRFLRGEPIDAQMPSSLQGLARVARRREVRLWTALGAAVLFLVAVVVAGSMVRDRWQREVERRVAIAMRPDADASEVAEAIAYLGSRASEESRGALTRRLQERRYADAVLAAPPSLGVAAALAVGNAALAAPESASLVGEAIPGDRTGGFPVGDRLLETWDAATDRGERADEVLQLAARLAAQRGDPAGALLRALVLLAKAGAPRAPLGGGRLGVAVTDDLERDLVAARGLAGAPGRRAAWLLADLSLAADDARAAKAIDEAARSHPDPVLEEKLRLVLGATKDGAGYGRARKQGPFVLSRFLARCGLPDALEHPELADAAGVDGVLAREDPHRFALAFQLEKSWATQPPELGQAHTLLNAPRRGGSSQLSKEKITDTGKSEEERIRGGVEPHKKEIDELLASALRAQASPLVLAECGDPARGLLTSPVFELLAARIDLLKSDDVFEAFSREDRNLTRGFPLQNIYFTEVWEPTSGKVGLAACKEWEERLERDMKEDPLVACCRSIGLEREVESAHAAARGLRRIEELLESPPADEAERDELVFGALGDMESLASLGGPAVLPWRARLRILAFEGAVGNAHARLDLRRALRLSGQLPVVGSSGDFPWWLEKMPVFFQICASVANALGDRSPALADDLMAAMVAWLHERAVAFTFDPRIHLTDPKDRVRAADSLLTDMGSDALRPAYEGARERFRKLKEAGRMSLSAEDEQRAREPTYTLRAHPITPR
ncbi:MAG TPA: serine/threonine-protein kinase [Planctomycetota bacterium]|nr:serine/threonine-protein kinase [Planctomycetota bacterium]